MKTVDVVFKGRVPIKLKISIYVVFDKVIYNPQKTDWFVEIFAPFCFSGGKTKEQLKEVEFLQRSSARI
ncbi:hypothetical protein [Methanolobus sp. ZRKC5]|uniref:hypothetical protein n=1 Tax=unclassified Methanolobus TaxID=2629569 RepID=UPI00313D9535